MEKEAEKAEPQKLRYLLRELAVTEAANSFEYNGYLANIYSVKSYYDANMDMLEADKFHSLLYSNQKFTPVLKMRKQPISLKNHMLKAHKLLQVVSLKDRFNILLFQEIVI